MLMNIRSLILATLLMVSTHSFAGGVAAIAIPANKWDSPAKSVGVKAISSCVVTVSSEWRAEPINRSMNTSSIVYFSFLIQPPVSIRTVDGVTSDKNIGSSQGIYFPKVSNLNPKSPYANKGELSRQFKVTHYYAIRAMVYSEEGIFPIHPSEYSNCVFHKQQKRSQWDPKYFRMNVFMPEVLYISSPDNLYEESK